MVPGRDHDPDDTKLPAGTPGSAGAHDAGAPGTVAPGTFVGPYKLLRYIDEGAMGEVWLAERRDTFRQKVALKLLTAARISPREAIARFDQEREVLASMSHDHVARIFDGGVHGGRPWFAMEFVDGEPITDFCDRRGLGVRERLALFRQVCDAVTHAHRRGIIHRDIKPSNILVGMGTGSVPQAKVIDFGIAKAMAQRLTDHTSITEVHRPIGTYEYMSPEQADPGGQDIDTRTDVYSLGVVLYELLSGVRPFDLEKRAMDEKVRIIREEDAPTPSLRLSTASARDAGTAERISKARREEIQHLVRALRSELEWIPLMAIRKDRERRYRDVDELSEDVQRYLDGRALVAAPESVTYRARKYVRRHRGVVAAVGAVLMALVVGLGVAWWQRGVAVQQLRRSNELLGVITMGGALDAVRRNDITGTRRELAELQELDRADRFAARLAAAWSNQSLGEPLRGHEGSVTSVCFSPDGRTLASASSDRTIRLWDASTRRPLGEPLRGHESSVRSVNFSPDGRTLASASGDRTIRLWDASTRRPLGEPLRGHGSSVTSVSFSPDGRTLASASLDSTIRLWDASTRRPLGEPLRGHESSVRSVNFSPDGRTLASASFDLTIRLWDASAGRPLGEPLRGHEREVTSVCFSHDGRTLASASWDQTIRLWDASTRRPLGEPLRGHEGEVTSVCFSPDGWTLASASGDKTIRLLSGVPVRDRVTAYRAQMAEVERARTMLAPRIAAVDDTIESVQAFGADVRADRRFTGDLRTAALIVVGEVDMSRQESRERTAAARRERLKPLEDAVREEDWARALQLVSEASPEDLSGADASFWNQLAWSGLTELAANSPARDLTRLLSYAERAVELSGRQDGAILDTLARAHWELGDKQTAIAVQEEAVRVGAGDGSTDESRRELADTLERYRSAEPPRPPGG